MLTKLERSLPHRFAQGRTGVQRLAHLGTEHPPLAPFSQRLDRVATYCSKWKSAASFLVESAREQIDSTLIGVGSGPVLRLRLSLEARQRRQDQRNPFERPDVGLAGL